MSHKYISIPEQVWDDKELSDQAKLLYGLIYSLHRYRGKQVSRAANRWYADKLNTNERQVQRCLKKLRAKEYIAITHHRGKDGKIKSRSITPLIKISFASHPT